MPQVSFKAKIDDIHYADGSLAYRMVKVPSLKRHHCDMQAFRSHRRFSSYANSDLFPSMLARAVKEAGVGSVIKTTAVPPCVTIDESGFLATVTIYLA